MVSVIRSRNALNYTFIYSDAAMQQWNGRWLKKRGWPMSLEEIRRFLDTWYFYISISGHLYVRPLRQTVTRRDLHVFLRRLDVLGEDLLPETMTFDFTMILMSPHRWRHITEVLRRYAEQINSASFVISDNRQSGGVTLIMRSFGRTKQLSRVCLHSVAIREPGRDEPLRSQTQLRASALPCNPPMPMDQSA